MNKPVRRMKKNEDGSVAVEFAAVLGTILIPLLAAALFFGRFFWHYTVAEKAAHDAARFLASASPTEMKVQCVSTRDACIVSAAQNLAYTEIDELNPGSALPQVTVYCDDQRCPVNRGSAVPKTVAVDILMTVEDPFLTAVTSFFTPDKGSIAIPINATARSYYVGN
jgi:Flp pilus assembly protein TadG